MKRDAGPVPSAPAAVTLAGVARAAGVHVSTVSLALNHSPKIAAATAARIRRLATQLGYHRDPVYFALSARRQLARGTPPLIAFVTNRDSMEDFHRVAHMPRFFAGARAEAERTGYACELFLVDDPRLNDAAFARRGVQGVILGALMPHLPPITLDWPRYALAKIDSAFVPPSAARVSYDQMQIIRLACARLHAAGYRRIGLAVGQYDEESSHHAFGVGFRLQQHQLGLPGIAPLLFAAGESFAGSSGRLRAWIADHRLDAVLSNWGSLRAMLAQAGLRVPDDIACASLCLHERDPFLAGAVMSHEIVGQKAVELVSLLIKSRQLGPQRNPPCLLVEGEWHQGASAPARNRRLRALSRAATRRHASEGRSP